MTPASSVVTSLAEWAAPKKQEQALYELDQSIADAITKAKAAGLPKGMIVVILHGHNFKETQSMVTNT